VFTKVQTSVSSRFCKRSVKIDVYLQHVFEALIIVANHRHKCWVCEYNSQSETYMLSVCSKCKREMLVSSHY